MLQFEYGKVILYIITGWQFSQFWGKYCLVLTIYSTCSTCCQIGKFLFIFPYNYFLHFVRQKYWYQLCIHQFNKPGYHFPKSSCPSTIRKSNDHPLICTDASCNLLLETYIFVTWKCTCHFHLKPSYIFISLLLCEPYKWKFTSFILSYMYLSD